MGLMDDITARYTSGADLGALWDFTPSAINPFGRVGGSSVNYEWQQYLNPSPETTGDTQELVTQAPVAQAGPDYSQISPLSINQFQQAVDYVEGTDTYDFIDMLGRVISPGTKLPVPDKNGNITGYYFYNPEAAVTDALRTDNPQVANPTNPYDPHSAFALTADPENNDWFAGPNAYSMSWDWIPATPNAPKPNLSHILANNGLSPDMLYGGTIGQGGWNAIRGIITPFTPLLSSALSGANGLMQGANQGVSTGLQGLGASVQVADTAAPIITQGALGAGTGAVKGLISGGDVGESALYGGLGGMASGALANFNSTPATVPTADTTGTYTMQPSQGLMDGTAGMAGSGSQYTYNTLGDSLSLTGGNSGLQVDQALYPGFDPSYNTGIGYNTTPTQPTLLNDLPEAPSPDIDYAAWIKKGLGLLSGNQARPAATGGQPYTPQNFAAPQTAAQLPKPTAQPQPFKPAENDVIPWQRYAIAPKRDFNTAYLDNYFKSDGSEFAPSSSKKANNMNIGWQAYA